MSKKLNYYVALIAISAFLSFFVLKLTQGDAISTVPQKNTDPQKVKVVHPEGPVPGDYFDLSTWKLTLPVDTDEFDGDPNEIEQPDLNNYADDYFYYDKTKQAMVFKTPVDGGQTDNTKYSRSELRELPEDGDWDSDNGLHTLEIEQAVVNLPKNKPHVVVGQIHDEEDDVYVFRLEDKKLYANADDDDNDVVFTEDYKLGEKFTVKFEVENNETKVYYNGELMNTFKKEYSGAYFKVGAYVQASCTYSSGDDFEKEDCSDSKNIPYAQVEVYNIKTCHNTVCTSKP